MSSYRLLFSRTMTVLLAMIGISYGGTLLAWNWVPSTGSFIAVSIVWLLSLIVTFIFAGKTNDPIAIAPAVIFSLLGGVISVPAISMYTETLGSQQVMAAMGMCGGALVVTGFIGYIANFAYAKLESFLMLCLFGLIGYNIATFFVGLDPTLDLTMSYIGAGVFTLFLLVDFMLLKDEAKRGNAGWGMAVSIAVGMYLDLLNLFLYILRIMGSSDD